MAMGTKDLAGAPEGTPADGATPPTADVDVVASPSYNADGTAAQTPGYIHLGE